jgi:hypothetical protein
LPFVEYSLVYSSVVVALLPLLQPLLDGVASLLLLLHGAKLPVVFVQHVEDPLVYGGVVVSLLPLQPLLGWVA